MFMTRWQPMVPVWQDMNRLRAEMDRLFGPPVGEEAPEFVAAYPAMNVWEDANNLYAEVELPGMKPEELNVEVAEGVLLTISGERKPVEIGKGVWQRQERGPGKFKRTIELPVPIDAEKVAARFENGVLFLTLPRAESAKPRRIAVKGG